MYLFRFSTRSWTRWSCGGSRRRATWRRRSSWCTSRAGWSRRASWRASTAPRPRAWRTTWPTRPTRRGSSSPPTSCSTGSNSTARPRPREFWIPLCEPDESDFIFLVLSVTRECRPAAGRGRDCSCAWVRCRYTARYYPRYLRQVKPCALMLRILNELYSYKYIILLKY